VTSDRARDVSEGVRKEVEKRLLQANAPDEWTRAVREHVPVAAAEKSEFFGESLPAGLQLDAS
jgi:hypothetical protein